MEWSPLTSLKSSGEHALHHPLPRSPESSLQSKGDTSFSLNQNLYFYFYVCVCVSVSVWRVWGMLETRFSGTEVTGYRESPSMGAGNQIPVSARAASTLHYWAISSAPALLFFFSTFVDSLWLSHHASQYHLIPLALASSLCPCNHPAPAKKNKTKFKRKTKTKQTNTQKKGEDSHCGSCSVPYWVTV